ncbi:MAG: hypothetical protein ACRD1K_04290 [Acidimicrobiales bacterium]
MNELADHYRYRHEMVDLVKLSLWLAQVPCSPLFTSHGSPERELRSILGGSP